MSSSSWEFPKPEIIIPRLILEKINHFVQKGNNHECSGLGLTRIVGDKIYIDDVFMVKQRNSGATTDMDADAVNRLMFETREMAGNLNFWWHSHADMGVFWSTTDRDTIKQIGGGGTCIAAVFNKKREVRAAVSCLATLPWMEKPVALFMDEVKMLCETEIDDEIKNIWDQEYDANVLKPSYQTSFHNPPSSALPKVVGLRDPQALIKELLDPYHPDWKAARMDCDEANSKWENDVMKYRKSPTQIQEDREFAAELSGRSLPVTSVVPRTPDGKPDWDKIGAFTRNSAPTSTTSTANSGLDTRTGDEETAGTVKLGSQEDHDKMSYAEADPTIEDYNPVWNHYIMRSGEIVDCDAYIAKKKRLEKMVDEMESRPTEEMVDEALRENMYDRLSMMYGDSF